MAHKTLRGAGANQGDKVDIQMTPMLDMIFQLLVFFILTFNPGEEERQLEVKMASAPPAEARAVAASVPVPYDDLDFDARLALVLSAAPNGELARATVGELAVARLVDLRGVVARLVGPDPEVVKLELTADAHLDYQYVMQAVEIVSHAGVKNISFGAPR